MLYLKYFIFYNALGEIVQVILNFALFDVDNYRHIFYVFTFMSIFAIYLQYKFLNNKISNNNK